jgi:hypothetical protein
MTETAVTLPEDDEDTDYEGYMNFGDGAILSIEELLAAIVALDKQKEIEYTSG